jgi:hypothetical protein
VERVEDELEIIDDNSPSMMTSGHKIYGTDSKRSGLRCVSTNTCMIGSMRDFTNNVKMYTYIHNTYIHSLRTVGA